MATVYPSRLQLPRSRRWLTYLMVLCAGVLAILAFMLVPLTENSMRLNARQVFESSRWNAMQLQLQSYRLMNYISDLEEADMPLNGNAYFQYDLVLSRVDLLRDGEIGNHIRSFSNGRATRLLNIIAGELELISLNLEHLENGRIDQAAIIMDRLRALDTQITDFVVIVNQGANRYVTAQREQLNLQLERLEYIGILLTLVAALLALFALKSSYDLRSLFRRNGQLEDDIRHLQKEKSDVIARIIAELKPNLITMTGWSSSALQSDDEWHRQSHLEQLSDLSGHLLTQVDSYHDLILIESGQFVPQHTEGELKSHIEYSVNAMKQQLLAQNIRLMCFFDPRLVQSFEADFKRLHEILTMLLGQLSQHCPNAAMLVHVRPSALPILETRKGELAKDTRMVQISIRDRGQGLPSNVQQGLRSNPHNPGNSIISQIHNIGVGFTLSQYLISTLGGELHFSSSTENGTEMWVDLPMKTVANVYPAKRSKVGTIAILDNQITSDDIFEIGLGDASYGIEPMTHEHLLKPEVTSGFTPYHAVLLADQRILDVEALEALLALQSHDVKLFATESIRRQHPELNISAIFTLPLTETQLEQLICA
ncbi:sensor histidine kinase [Marinomonas ostreistagni]|uniref:sensor histidine kinase n=1 Tax=Marinomonas ostreistagni TaxID=359209 RepID=UPI0019527BDA|nr:ATP-binding protein [Marinomonas ostreistagni]MBM6550602.1 HAMP domain-containing histidine kinase [Marinomonas ostreistagni]